MALVSGIYARLHCVVERGLCQYWKLHTIILNRGASDAKSSVRCSSQDCSEVCIQGVFFVYVSVALYLFEAHLLFT